MRFRLGRALGLLMVFGGVFGLVAGVLSVGSANAAAPNPRAFPNDNALINSGNVPADSTTYNGGNDCGEAPTPTSVGWYFVLPPGTANGADTFEHLDLKFQNAGTLTDVPFVHALEGNKL